MMKTIIFVLSLCCGLTNLVAQKAQSSGVNRTGSSPNVVAINPSFVVSNSMRLGRLELKSLNRGKHTLFEAYANMLGTISIIGGNAFKVDSVGAVSDGALRIFVSVYDLSANDRIANDSLIAYNKVFVLGSLDLKQSDKKICVNHRKIKLKPLHFTTVDNSYEVNVQMGGFFKVETTIKSEPNKAPIYLSQRGVGVSNVSPDHFGIAFHSGSIYKLDNSLGLFLVQVLKEVK